MTNVVLHVSAADGPRDLKVVMADGATVAEVFDALCLPVNTTIDGANIDSPTATPAASVLSAGSELSVTPAAPPGSVADGFVDLAVVAGLNAGGTARLGPGLFHLTVASSASQSAWVVQVDDRERALAHAKSWQQHGGSVEVMGQGVGPMLAIGSPVDPEPAQNQTRGGTTTVNRPPRASQAALPRPIELGDVPAEVREPSPLSWATMLAPIPIALMMAFFFRPIFALFAAMGPIMALGRWWESRRRYRRNSTERAQLIAAMRHDVRRQVALLSEAEARRQWLSNPHVAALWQRATAGSVRLWQRRPGSHGYMTAVLGVGENTAPIVIATRESPPELADLVADPMPLRSVPHVVDLSVDTAIGVCGAPEHALAVAYSLLVQLATTHGPADLRVGVVCAPENAHRWDWLKWLPHLDPGLVGQSAAAIVGNMPAPTRPIYRTATQDNPGPIRLVVLDAQGVDGAALERASIEAGVELRCIAIASEPTALPAMCSRVARVTANEMIVDGQAAQKFERMVPTGISSATAESWARSLARFRDPEVTAITARDDQPVSFLEMVGHTNHQDRARHWAGRAANATPSIILGHGPHGRFHLDLTVDGPHALIAGTTGSGKSELLRTLVAGLAAECSPDQMNLVLVDFKGGGAFDIVRELPHVVGMITDLDEVLVARALVSLRAELERRERLFRDLGVSSFAAAADVSSVPLARLVIVIDEFAALATDYAELMNGIVDLAARGRSLGMHLVLATQRPSGVVDQKIRANTNIRIALRVQDEFDSQDVVGTADAAHIDRRTPGSAIVRIGGDRAVPIHMAFSGSVDTSDQQFLIRAHQLFAEDGSGEQLGQGSAPADPVEGEARETELEILVQAIVQASTVEDLVVRPLWAPPLPTHLDWIDLGTRELAASTAPAGFALGLADLPEQQVQLPWRWDPACGALGIYGASGPSAGKALVSLGAAMASASPPHALHLYVVDGDAGASSTLAALPHTGACIRSDETDRVERVIRLFEATLGARRTSSCATDPQLVLLIDNLAAVLAAHDEVQSSILNDRLAALARDGSALGVHLAITARTPRDITHRLAQQIPNRLVMELADPNGFLALGLRLRDVVPLPPMRAIDPRTQDVVQLVEPPDVSSLVSDSAEQHRVAAPVHTFPSTVDASDLGGASIDVDGVLTIPIGIESVDLGHAALTLRPGEHVLVVATPGMGRSSAAKLIAGQLGHLDVSVPVVHVGAPSLAIESVQVLADVEETTVVIVDDAESLPPPMALAMESLLASNNPHVRVVATVRPDAARSARSWIARIRAGGTGLLLGGAATDGDIFRIKLGSLVGRGAIPGRGNLIDRGRVVGLQLASPNAAD